MQGLGGNTVMWRKHGQVWQHTTHLSSPLSGAEEEDCLAYAVSLGYAMRPSWGWWWKTR